MKLNNSMTKQKTIIFVACFLVLICAVATPFIYRVVSDKTSETAEVAKSAISSEVVNLFDNVTETETETVTTENGADDMYFLDTYGSDEYDEGYECQEDTDKWNGLDEDYANGCYSLTNTIAYYEYYGYTVNVTYETRNDWNDNTILEVAHVGNTVNILVNRVPTTIANICNTTQRSNVDIFANDQDGSNE